MTQSPQLPAVEHRLAQPYVAISARIASEAEFRHAADTGFPRLFGWLQARAIAPAGPPFVRYRAFDPAGDPVQIELGVSVTDLPEGDRGIEAAVLPAGAWLTYLHRGPYSHAGEPDLQAAHATARAWAQENGLALAREPSDDDEIRLAGCIEQYRIGPHEEPDYTRWETELAYLIDPQVEPARLRASARRRTARR
jgi:effector-binding domain-containing protein